MTGADGASDGVPVLPIDESEALMEQRLGVAELLYPVLAELTPTSHRTAMHLGLSDDFFVGDVKLAGFSSLLSHGLLELNEDGTEANYAPILRVLRHVATHAIGWTSYAFITGDVSATLLVVEAPELSVLLRVDDVLVYNVEPLNPEVTQLEIFERLLDTSFEDVPSSRMLIQIDRGLDTEESPAHERRYEITREETDPSSTPPSGEHAERRYHLTPISVATNVREATAELSYDELLERMDEAFEEGMPLPHDDAELGAEENSEEA